MNKIFGNVKQYLVKLTEKFILFNPIVAKQTIFGSINQIFWLNLPKSWSTAE